jgi:hypothetical protein
MDYNLLFCCCVTLAINAFRANNELNIYEIFN